MTTHDAITQYVVLRQAAGADFRPTARLLGAFCRAVGPHVPLVEIPVEGVRAFVDGHPRAAEAAMVLARSRAIPLRRADLGPLLCEPCKRELAV